MTREEELLRVSTNLLCVLIKDRGEVPDWAVKRAIEGADKLVHAVYEKVNGK